MADDAGEKGRDGRHGRVMKNDDAERGGVGGVQPRPARASVTEKLSIFLHLPFDQAVQIIGLKGNHPSSIRHYLGCVRSRQREYIMARSIGERFHLDGYL